MGFGLSGEIAALIAENLDSIVLKAPVMRLAVPNVPTGFGDSRGRAIVGLRLQPPLT